MTNIEALLDNIYNSFTPMPLPAGDPQYVECREVRGDVEIEQSRLRTSRCSTVDYRFVSENTKHKYSLY
ncbi:MAG: hypothetical protein RID53_16375 [Coleofasciculus sp. B1-GNL1-01]|uniref:hypothetical protein n=1 Tax=Coleofasciculus sp. B1-GNL1-01 TaxID=3068484 RepID=UPI0032F4BF1C